MDHLLSSVEVIIRIIQHRVKGKMPGLSALFVTSTPGTTQAVNSAGFIRAIAEKSNLISTLA